MSEKDPRTLLEQFSAAIAAATPLRTVAISSVNPELTDKNDGDVETEAPAKSNAEVTFSSAAEVTSSDTESTDGPLSFIEVYVNTHGAHLQSKQAPAASSDHFHTLDLWCNRLGGIAGSRPRHARRRMRSG